MLPLAQGLLKFSHCQRDVFCSRVPPLCPICGQSVVASWRLEEAPVHVPCPFVNGHREKCSFLVKPTRGEFLGDYDGDSDLHVGITDTSGVVYHYNETGVRGDTLGWEQCVSVPLVPPDNYALIDQWDGYLTEHAASEQWLPHRYSERDHNCCSFALRFINRILSLLEKPPLSTTQFTERFVLPRTRRASKYLSVCREVSQHGFYAVHREDR
ncbi:MKRN2 opposite strand protein [Spea bombifrons]|uniref:MKRN2 opposite strand protein n=1 Tax=Spea bombifrons TaxID=233779 RepID=UPI002349AD08|nr:MKRN2 opposite strand protein [Spea bombifrons]